MILTAADSEESEEDDLLARIVKEQEYHPPDDEYPHSPASSIEVPVYRNKKRAIVLSSESEDGDLASPPPSLPPSPSSPPPSPPQQQQDQHAVDEQKRTTRKRTRNEDGWKRNQKKRAKCSGQAYKTTKGKEKRARQMGASCGVKCRYKCKGKITEEQRARIFEQYWGLGDVQRQREFIAKNVCKVEKHRKPKAQGPSRRNFSYHWTFDVENRKTTVCKTYFLATLDVSDKAVATACAKKTTEGFVKPDNRGKQQNKGNKLPDAVKQSVHDHIASFPRVLTLSEKRLEQGVFRRRTLPCNHVQNVYRVVPGEIFAASKEVDVRSCFQL